MTTRTKKTKTTAKKNIERSMHCRAFRHNLDGPVFLEKRGRGSVWVAYLECSDCGTRRVDVMTPKTCQLLHRSYEYEDDYDTQMTALEAKQVLFLSKLVSVA